MLNAVDTASVAGRSGLPMLHIQERRSDGTWTFGQKQHHRLKTAASGPSTRTTFQCGFICFDNDNKFVGEHLVPVSQPMPDVTELPDKGFAWQEQWAVNMKCIGGADAGTEVIYKTTTVGGIQAVAGLIEAVRDRLNGGQHDGKVVADRAARKGLLPASVSTARPGRRC